MLSAEQIHQDNSKSETDMSKTRTIDSFLAQMPKTESLEAAQLRVEVAWETVRDLFGVGHRPHMVEVENYLKAAQIHRDRIERDAQEMVDALD